MKVPAGKACKITETHKPRTDIFGVSTVCDCMYTSGDSIKYSVVLWFVNLFVTFCAG